MKIIIYKDMIFLDAESLRGPFYALNSEEARQLAYNLIEGANEIEQFDPNGSLGATEKA